MSASYAGGQDQSADEVWILWEDHSVTYLHMDEQTFRTEFNHSVEPVYVRYEGLSEPVYEEIWLENENYLLRCRAIEKLLENAKAAWMFGSDKIPFGSNGIVTMSGEVIFFPIPHCNENGTTMVEVLKPNAGNTVTAVTGKMITTNRGVWWTDGFSDGIRMKQLTTGSDILQVEVSRNEDLAVLHTDGTLTVVGEDASGTQCPFRALDEQYIRLFPGTGYAQTSDYRLVKILKNAGEENEIQLERLKPIDQFTTSGIIVYQTGTLQYPADAPNAEWLSTIIGVKTVTNMKKQPYDVLEDASFQLNYAKTNG